MKLLYLLSETLTAIFWTLLMFGFDTPKVAALTLVAAIIHELGHIIALKILGKGARPLPRARISGLRISVHSLSYKDELILAAAGPLMNFFCALFTLPIACFELSRLFISLNVMTALSNLLPAPGYDGLRITECLFLIFGKNYVRAERVLFAISIITVSLLCLFSLYFILKVGEGYWIFAVFFTLLVSELTKRQNSTFCEKK